MLVQECPCGQPFKCPENNQDLETLIGEGRHNLLFAGVNVGVDKSNLNEICLDCSKHMSLLRLEMYMLLNPAGGVTVNWEGYLKDCNGKNDLRYVNDVLKNLGILSGYGHRNWIVMSQTQGCLNPRYGRSVNLYFTSPDDALAYAIAYEAIDQRAKRCHAMQIGHVFQV